MIFTLKTYTVIISVLIFSFHVYGSEEPCKQQYIFSSPQQESLDIISIPNSDITKFKEKYYSVGKSNYYTLKSDSTNEILIYSDKNSSSSLFTNATFQSAEITRNDSSAPYQNKSNNIYEEKRGDYEEVVDNTYPT